MSMLRENQLDNECESSDLSLLSRPKVFFIIDQNRDVIMKYINRLDIDATVCLFSDSIEGLLAATTDNPHVNLLKEFNLYVICKGGKK